MIILSIYSSGTAICYIAYCLDKLGLAVPSLTESMLVISKDAVRVKIIQAGHQLTGVLENTRQDFS